MPEMTAVVDPRHISEDCKGLSVICKLGICVYWGTVFRKDTGLFPSVKPWYAYFFYVNIEVYVFQKHTHLYKMPITHVSISVDINKQGC